MTHIVEQLAQFVVERSWQDLAETEREQLQIRVLDALGCAIGAIDAEPMRAIRDHVAELGGYGPCSLIGGGGAAPERAALQNGALVRYLDFNDSYLAPGETCHPSDNLAPVLAAAESADASGRELLTALAIAYQVQCRLCDEAPVRRAGFDHVSQGTFAVAAGAARALGLDVTRTAHAIAIAGTAFHALRVTRTGQLSHWKGLAYPAMAASALVATSLARHGITGPLEVFEGEKGFSRSIAGPFEIDWSGEGLDRVRRTVVKRHNAEIHAQTTIEAALELRRAHVLAPAQIERVEIEIFDVAFDVIGGGREGDKLRVSNKEQADHSLPYIVAVALLDGQVMPAQYDPERILREDVQQLMRRITVRPDPAFSARFPEQMPCRVIVTTRGGGRFAAEKRQYPGFWSQPFTREAASEKFRALTDARISSSLAGTLEQAVWNLPNLSVRALTRLFRQFGAPLEAGHLRVAGSRP
jgi:2-methylcitrate dehydratase